MLKFKYFSSLNSSIDDVHHLCLLASSSIPPYVPSLLFLLSSSSLSPLLPSLLPFPLSLSGVNPDLVMNPAQLSTFMNSSVCHIRLMNT